MNWGVLLFDIAVSFCVCAFVLELSKIVKRVKLQRWIKRMAEQAEVKNDADRDARRM